MGEHTEITRKEWGISRARQDEIALASHRNAVAVRSASPQRSCRLMALPATRARGPIHRWNALPRSSLRSMPMEQSPPAIRRPSPTGHRPCCS